ncbi:MAG: dihydroorotate dehydrogenase B (NAD(+)), catalytic subunit [Phycisphaerae bacterium]|nr:MAG: dihydroorotate dehydrogenase B (NAD(+)), catalytic subunit [Phycisphaerae bacterium]
MAAATESCSPDLSVNLCGIELANPVITASGTSGYGPEYAPLFDINALGGFVTKSVTLHERPGNPQPRTCETASGMLNAIGLANVGLERFCVEKVPFLSQLSIPVIVNVAGHEVSDYVKVCERLDEIDCIAAVELNVSCPNVSDGLEWGTDAKRLASLVQEVRKVVSRCKLIVKLTPNTGDIVGLAKGAIDGGAEILSLINTLRGMAIHVDTRKPMLANVTGGLSGPAIKPVALCMVHQVYQGCARESGIPIIAMGGIRTWRDAIEFHLAGATAIAVGTSLFVDPRSPLALIDGVRDYLNRHQLNSIHDVIGQVQLPSTH